MTKDFKSRTPSINFAIFGGSMYIYNQLRSGEETLQVQEEQNYFKKDFKKITSGNPKHKSEKQS